MEEAANLTPRLEEPVQKKSRAEVNADLPLTASALPVVQDLIRKNNAETRPKKRLRLMDLLNEAFYALGRDAIKDATQCENVLALFDEFVAVHKVPPRGATLAKVFYAWQDGGRRREALLLLRKLLASRGTVTDESFRASFDEKVVTVTLRLVTSAAAQDGSSSSCSSSESCSPTRGERRELVKTILAAAPHEALRRRVFSPLLAFARLESDWDFAARVLSMATERRIELWDGDYHEALATVELAEKAGSTRDETRERLDTVLGIMAAHQPVVGAENAVLVHRLGGGSMECTVSDTGECSRCKQTLSSFELTEEDRAGLLQDIEAKLISPRIEGVSHYEPEKKVTEEEKRLRTDQYDAFKKALADLPYDTVIDGANVGYYGLSSWYAAAKREDLLRRASQGSGSSAVVANDDGPESAEATGSPANALASIPVHPPFPVDVAPKFALIESIRQEAVRVGRHPLIILHSRHVTHGPPENMALLRTWREQNAFLASPAFLNDDYCWLYAAVARANTFIISNDLMRDHHFLMLSRRFFLRWRQRHRITYKAFYAHETGTAIPKIRMPRCYSVWVQRAVAKGVAHWHVPYLSSIPILDQATNRTTKTGADVDLSKDGDDTCSAWVCTSAWGEGRYHDEKVE